MRIHRVDLWITVAGIAASVFAVVSWGTLPLPEHSGEIIATFGVLMVLVAVYLRIWYALPPTPGAPGPRLIWFLPAIMTAILSPALVAVADDRTPPVVSVLLFLLIAYTSALLGVLFLFLVLLPLEALGRGILRLVTGRPEGGWLVFVGALGLLVTSFGIVGAFALDDLPPGRAGWAPIIAALFGIPGAYTVESVEMLWVTRAIGLVLVAMVLAAAHFPRRRAERVARESAEAKQVERERSTARRRAQLARDEQRRSADE